MVVEVKSASVSWSGAGGCSGRTAHGGPTGLRGRPPKGAQRRAASPTVPTSVGERQHPGPATGPCLRNRGNRASPQPNRWTPAWVSARPAPAETSVPRVQGRLQCRHAQPCRSFGRPAVRPNKITACNPYVFCNYNALGHASGSSRINIHMYINQHTHGAIRIERITVHIHQVRLAMRDRPKAAAICA